MSTPVPPPQSRVVLFTDLPEVAAAYTQILPELGYRIVGVITSRKRNPAFHEVVRATPFDADVIVSDRPRRWAQMVAPLRPDLIISTTFPWRIPQDVLDLPPLGAINVHPSVLPRYRGTMTPNWTLYNGEPTGGITVHRMVGEFDAGPVLAQVEIPLSGDEDIATYMGILFAHAPAVIAVALQRVADGYAGDPQDESQMSYYGVMPDDLRLIDWNSPARKIHNQVRGFSGFIQPAGALGTIDGVTARILRTQLIDAGEQNPALPGTVLSRDADGLVVQCGDGPIRLLSYAFEPAERVSAPGQAAPGTPASG